MYGVWENVQRVSLGVSAVLQTKGSWVTSSDGAENGNIIIVVHGFIQY